MQLPPPNLCLIIPLPCSSRLRHDLILALNLDRRLAALQPNEFADPPSLLLKSDVRVPAHRTRVVARPSTRRPLVVEVRQALELGLCEEPVVEHGRGEGRVNLPRGELHERCEGQGHLPEFLGECWPVFVGSPAVGSLREPGEFRYGIQRLLRERSDHGRGGRSVMAAKAHGRGPGGRAFAGERVRE